MASTAPAPSTDLNAAATDPLSLIHREQKRHDAAAEHRQMVRSWWGKRVSVIGPFAVVLLAIHVVFDSHAWGLALTFVAVLCLLAAVWCWYFSLDFSHHVWIDERLRAELLRREEFLLRARVGPYLNCSEANLLGTVRGRLHLIKDHANPLELTSPSDGQRDWQDALEECWASGRTDGNLPNWPACIAEYLERRVYDQAKWFRGKIDEHTRKARRFEGWTKVLLLAAFLVALAHFGLVWRGWEVRAGWRDLVFRFVELTAICLPAVAAVFVAWASLSQSEKVAASYSHFLGRLFQCERRLQGLEAHIAQREEKTTPAGLGPSAAPLQEVNRSAQLEFQRTVLSVEQVLSSELRAWWLLFHAQLPKPEL
jgi:SMODS and SLOG-associating 2TM effector domain 1